MSVLNNTSVTVQQLRSEVESSLSSAYKIKQFILPEIEKAENDEEISLKDYKPAMEYFSEVRQWAQQLVQQSYSARTKCSQICFREAPIYSSNVS